MEELKEWWDVEYKIREVEDPKYFAEVEIIIKNHSPLERTFEYYLKNVNLNDDVNLLKFYLYTGLSAKNKLKVGRYKKEKIKIMLPRLPVKNDTLHMEIGIKKEGENEEKVLLIDIPIRG